MARSTPADRKSLQKANNGSYARIDGDKFNPSDYILDYIYKHGIVSDILEYLIDGPLIFEGLALSNSGNNLVVSNGSAISKVAYDATNLRNNDGTLVVTQAAQSLYAIGFAVSYTKAISVANGVVGNGSTINYVRARLVWNDEDTRNQNSNPLVTYAFTRSVRLEVVFNPVTPADYPIQLGSFTCVITAGVVSAFTLTGTDRSSTFRFSFSAAPVSEVAASASNELMRKGEATAYADTKVTNSPTWAETTTAPSAASIDARFVDNVSAESIAGVKTFTDIPKIGTTTLDDSAPSANNDVVRKDYAESLRSPSSKRQVIVAGRMGQYYANFIEAGTGLSATLKASPTVPLVASLAAGTRKLASGVGATRDYTIHVEADLTYSGLTANATNFFVLERATNGSISTATTLLEPIYGNVYSSDLENKVAASFNGTDGDRIFTDLYGNIFKCYGSAGTKITSATQRFGGNTLRLNGTDGYVEMSNPPKISRKRGFTVEFDYRFDTTGSTENIFELTRTNAIGSTAFILTLLKNSSEVLELSWGTGGSWIVSGVGCSNTLSSATWYHLQFSMEGNVLRFYINGNLARTYNTVYIAEYDENSDIPYAAKLLLGVQSSGSYYMTGNIANLGIWPYIKNSKYEFTVGNAIFTPPSATITADTPNNFRYIQRRNAFLFSFTDTAYNNKTYYVDPYGNTAWFFQDKDSGANIGAYIKSTGGKWGGSCLRLDGPTGAHMANRVFNIERPGKFTFRMWVNRDNLTNTATLIGYDGTYSLALLSTATTGKLNLSLSSNGSSWNIADLTAGSTSMVAGNWHHVELTYDGETYRAFLDGNLEITTPSRLQAMWPRAIWFGQSSGGSQQLVGYMNDFELLPYCLHTANFTPPTSSPAPADHYVFDIPSMVMYKGVSGSYTAKPAIFIGEAVTGATRVERTVSYALNAKCNPVRIFGNTRANNSNSLYFRHNIGVKDVLPRVDFIWLRSRNGYNYGDIIWGVNAEYNAGAVGVSFPGNSSIDRNTIAHSSGYNTYGFAYQVADRASFTYIIAVAGEDSNNDGDIQISAERTW